MVQAYLLGYAIYVFEIFLPGVGLGELLNAWKKDDPLGAKFAYALGLGLAFDTLVILLRTSGIEVLGFKFSGIDQATIYVILAAGLMALVVATVRKKRFDFPARPAKADFALFLMIVFVGLVLLLYFQKYPIFPEYQEPDAGTHVEIAQGLVSGALTSVPSGILGLVSGALTPTPSGILYYGVHYQLASALVLVGGEGLVTVQRTVAILVMLSVLLVYLVGARIFSSERVGLVAATIYSLSGMIWFNSVFTSGLYANLVGMMAIFFFLVVYLRLAGNIVSFSSWVGFGLAILMVYFSHYTAISIFPAVLLIPLGKFAARSREAKSYLVPSLVALAPAGVGLAFFPGAATSLLDKLLGAPGLVTGSTALSGILSAIPFLSDMALIVSDDVAFVLLMILVAIYAYRIGFQRKALFFIPMVWFVSLLLASFASQRPERFSFEALMPVVLMAGYGLSSLVPRLDPSKGKIRRHNSSLRRKVKSAIVLIILLTPVMVNSSAQHALVDSTTYTDVSASSQQEMYNAMYWLKVNTPANSTYLSLSDWHFTYTSLLFGRVTSLYYTSYPLQALQAAQAAGARYIIVTYVTTWLPARPNLYPWIRIQQSVNLSLVYSNVDVRIFKVL